MRRQRSVAVQKIFLPSAPLGFQGCKVLMGKWDSGPVDGVVHRETGRSSLDRFAVSLAPDYHRRGDMSTTATGGGAMPSLDHPGQKGRRLHGGRGRRDDHL